MYAGSIFYEKENDKENPTVHCSRCGRSGMYFGCENLEVAFAETATVTDATAEDATAGENGDDTDIESAETMFVGDTGVQADATGTDATEMEAYDEISGVSVLNANTQKHRSAIKI